MVGRRVRVSHPIIGSPAFIERIFTELNAEDASSETVRTAERERQRRPGIRELLVMTCEVFKLAERDFYERPKATRPRLARQVLVWLWVKRSRGTQAQLARYLSVGGDQVSRWFGRAVDDYEQLEPFIERVEELLPRDEPLLASGDPDRITVNVEIVDD